MAPFVSWGATRRAAKPALISKQHLAVKFGRIDFGYRRADLPCQKCNDPYEDGCAKHLRYTQLIPLRLSPRSVKMFLSLVFLIVAQAPVQAQPSASASAEDYFAAVRKNDAAAVEQMLTRGLDVNTR